MKKQVRICWPKSFWGTHARKMPTSTKTMGTTRITTATNGTTATARKRMAETRLFAHRPLCLFPVSACAYFCMSFFSRESRHEKSNKYYTHIQHIHHTKLQYFLHWLQFGSVWTGCSTKWRFPSRDIVFRHHSWFSLPVPIFIYICSLSLFLRFNLFLKPFFSFCLFRNVCVRVCVCLFFL